jgi:hypothetical protein
MLPQTGVKPPRWLSVLRELNKAMTAINGADNPTTFKTYKSVYKAGRSKRLRACRVPSVEEIAR